MFHDAGGGCEPTGQGPSRDRKAGPALLHPLGVRGRGGRWAGDPGGVPGPDRHGGEPPGHQAHPRRPGGQALLRPQQRAEGDRGTAGTAVHGGGLRHHRHRQVGPGRRPGPTWPRRRGSPCSSGSRTAGRSGQRSSRRRRTGACSAAQTRSAPRSARQDGILGERSSRPPSTSGPRSRWCTPRTGPRSRRRC